MKVLSVRISALVFGSNRSVFLWGLFAIAFAIRIALVVVYGNPTTPQMYEHGEIAHNLYTGHGFSMHWPYESLDSSRRAVMAQAPQHEGAFLPPMNPYIIYGAYLIFGETPVAKESLMIFYALIGALCAPMVYRTALLIGTERRSRVAAIVSALFLPAAYAVVTFSGSVLYHLLGVTVLYCGFQFIQRRGVKPAVLFGLSCGVMTMVRSEFFFLGLLLIASVTVYPWKDIRKNYKALMAATIVFVAVVSPWSIRNYLLFDTFVPVLSHPWYEMWRGNNPQATGTTLRNDGSPIWVTPQDFPALIKEMDAIPYDLRFEPKVDQIFKREVFQFISEHPGRFLILGAKKILFLFSVDFSDTKARFWMNIVFVMGVILATSRGYVRLMRSPLPTEKLLISTFVLSYLFFTFMTLMLSRYQFYLVGSLLPLLAIDRRNYSLK